MGAWEIHKFKRSSLEQGRLQHVQDCVKRKMIALLTRELHERREHDRTSRTTCSASAGFSEGTPMKPRTALESFGFDEPRFTCSCGILGMMDEATITKMIG